MPPPPPVPEETKKTPDDSLGLPPLPPEVAPAVPPAGEIKAPELPPLPSAAPEKPEDKNKEPDLNLPPLPPAIPEKPVEAAPAPSPAEPAPPPPIDQAAPTPITPAPAVPPVAEKKDGFFPTLTHSFRKFLGGEEEAPKPAPAVAPPVPAATEMPPPPDIVDQGAPTPAPTEGTAAKETKPEDKAPELPPLPDTSKETQPAPAAPELPPLPPAEKKSEETAPGLPSLDALTAKPDENDALKMVERQTGKTGDSALPPLPTAEAVPDAKIDLPEKGPDKTNKSVPVPSVSESPMLDLPPLPPADAAKAPEAAKNSKDAPKEQQMASLPDTGKEPVAPTAAAGAPAMSVEFSESETEVPLSAQPALQDLAKSIIAKKNARVSVVAYASGGADQASLARRVSLRRGLAVRAFLIDMGVDNFAITVNAHGNKNDGGAAERVDVFLK